MKTIEEIILRGPAAVAAHAGLDVIAERPTLIVFDELHKYRRWKLFLKGLFDTYESRTRILVTGSSRLDVVKGSSGLDVVKGSSGLDVVKGSSGLDVVTGSSGLDVYPKGGDSLMGRYFLFHMHPFSVGELLGTTPPSAPVHPPGRLSNEEWKALWEHGGYPEPFVRRDRRFSLRWRELRRVQLLREEVRDLTRIQELDQIAVLGRLLERRSGGQLVYSPLAREVRVSENTIRSWISTLCSLYFGFLVRPWHRNVAKSLRKEPKWFLRDWSGIDDEGKRSETLCACHLLKAVEGWTDMGFGSFELHYIRDKQKREVDFLVIRDGEPWFLVEVKHRDKNLSPDLVYFQKQIGCPHAFQIVTDSGFVEQDCFSYGSPVVVPARTFFSQLP